MTESLEKVLSEIDGQKMPPVEQWNPELCGEIDIKILKNGDWIHEGRLMTRKKLVKLFASVLKFEEGRYYLVTPVEKVEIQVEEAPFVVISAEQIEDRWFLTSNLDEVVELTAQRNLNTEKFDYPVVQWRRNLIAKLNQNVMYQLQVYALEHGKEEGGYLKIMSGSDSIAIGAL
jgi:hypothetical protein